ncbi:WhiB family transcriptional regulator [Streptomyces spirodelae]|uniref:WhiB family transcriptional regulator n=1 Tax=Streptomyces spirodelae TaxID=2812904 RepID=UPI0027DB4298|nr:WhiB family transcriptional regulator [Streptomyces spirodelae]
MPTRTRCRTEPALFAAEDITASRERKKALAKARRACSACPPVDGCLKWPLANPELTPVGAWAATTRTQCTQLRRELIERLGPGWVGIVAEQDRERDRRQAASRPQPDAHVQTARRSVSLCHAGEHGPYVFCALMQMKVQPTGLLARGSVPTSGRRSLPRHEIRTIAGDADV